MYQKIFVAIDDSPTAAKALAEAVALARQAGGALCIAHAADEGLLAQHGMGIGTFIDIEGTKGAIRQAGQALLDQARQTAAAAGVAAEIRLLEATNLRVAEQIADGAGEYGADLIVVGTHGRRGFERFILGSVAEQLVRLAPVSVLLVRKH